MSKKAFLKLLNKTLTPVKAKPETKEQRKDGGCNVFLHKMWTSV